MYVNGGGEFIIGRGEWIRKDFSNNEHEKNQQQQDLTGSAIVKGNFFTKSSNIPHFAVSSPNFNNMEGKVYMCNGNCFHSGNQLRKDDTYLDGEDGFGTRFGASLAVVDLNHDGFDDILVGAPLYSDEKKVPKSKPHTYV